MATDFSQMSIRTCSFLRSATAYWPTRPKTQGIVSQSLAALRHKLSSDTAEYAHVELRMYDSYGYEPVVEGALKAK